MNTLKSTITNGMKGINYIFTDVYAAVHFVFLLNWLAFGLVALFSGDRVLLYALLVMLHVVLIQTRLHLVEARKINHELRQMSKTSTKESLVEEYIDAVRSGNMSEYMLKESERTGYRK